MTAEAVLMGQRLVNGVQLLEKISAFDRAGK
jgi:hypothetical protein